VDTISMGGAAQDVIKQIGAQAWDSPELDEYPTGDLGKNADHTIATILQFGRVFTYNTKLVPEKDVPHQWEDLLKPYWKNKMVFVSGPSVMPLMLGGLIHDWGRDRAVDYINKLSKQNVTILGVQPAAVTGMVGSGDFLGTYGAIHRVTILQKTGAPIGYSVLGDTVFTQIQTMQLPPTPAHPYAALLFTDFILSSQDGKGQKIFKDFGYPPTNPKVVDGSGPLETHKKWILTTEILQANLDDWTKVIKQAFP
jgi:ABC-type Fe3+ transport system substrate-binding protein